MPDVVDAATRSRMMAGIQGKNTKPEILLRKGLHRRGFRYGLHSADVPGKPDMVFRSRRAVIFVHGCFWHGHDCHLFRWPATRSDFWRTKINGSRNRDTKTLEWLRADGWRIGIVWECAIKRPSAVPAAVNQCAKWLCSSRSFLEVRGIP